MEETINVIETAIQDKKEYIRRLNNEREKLIEGLSDNFSNRISTEKQIAQLEINLKEIYDLTYNKKSTNDCNLKMGDIGSSTGIKASHGESRNINIGSDIRKG